MFIFSEGNEHCFHTCMCIMVRSTSACKYYLAYFSDQSHILESILLRTLCENSSEHNNCKTKQKQKNISAQVYSFLKVINRCDDVLAGIAW